IIQTGDHDELLVRELFLCLSKNYLAALEGIEALCPPGVLLKRSDVTRGRMLASLYAWLNPELVEIQNKPDRARRIDANFCGIKIEYSNEEIKEITSKWISWDKDEAGSSFWHVVVHGRRVGVKRLASLLTGVPVSKFHTDAAKRLLVRLGMT